MSLAVLAIHQRSCVSRFVLSSFELLQAAYFYDNWLQIAEIKSYLNDKNAPFGVDLLIPQVGGNARKTNVSVRVL